MMKIANLIKRSTLSKYTSTYQLFNSQTAILLQNNFHTTTTSLHRCVRDMSESTFDQRADLFLEDLMDDLEGLESTAGKEFEIDYAMGVLTLVLNEDTTYVLNKQRPNRQVWMSSPTSGPRRFELQEEEGVESWVDVRGGAELRSIMEAELKDIAPEADLDLTS